MHILILPEPFAKKLAGGWLVVAYTVCHRYQPVCLHPPSCHKSNPPKDLMPSLGLVGHPCAPYYIFWHSKRKKLESQKPKAHSIPNTASATSAPAPLSPSNGFHESPMVHFIPPTSFLQQRQADSQLALLPSSSCCQWQVRGRNPSCCPTVTPKVVLSVYPQQTHSPRAPLPSLGPGV